MNKKILLTMVAGAVMVSAAAFQGCATPGYTQECGKVEDKVKQESCIADWYDKNLPGQTREVAANGKKRNPAAIAAAAASMAARDPIRLQPKHNGNDRSN